MPYEFYKVIHLVSIMALFMALGGLTLRSMGLSSDQAPEKKWPGKRWALLFHGVGLVLILVSGFGLMARIGIPHGGWPGWIYGKFTIWLAMGGAAALVLRKPALAKLSWLLILGLGFAAVWLANTKMF